MFSTASFFMLAWVLLLLSAPTVGSPPATTSSFYTELLLNPAVLSKMEKGFLQRNDAVLKKVLGVAEKSTSSGFPGGGDVADYKYMQHIVYVKVPKAASSTTGGVARRIGFNHGLHGTRSRKWLEKDPYKHLPAVWANHERLSLLRRDIKKLKLPSFMFTVIREPVGRCLSMFYHFTVTKGGGKPSTENKVEALRDNECVNYLFRYTAPQIEPENAENWAASNVMKAYDFVGVAEMYEESMVVLAYLMNVPLGDILYIKAKVAKEKSNGIVAHSGLAAEPQVVQDYAASDEFRIANKLDYELYQAAVDRINRYYEEVPRLKETLAEYKALLRIATEMCTEDAKTVSRHNCYWGDNGCGFQCLDGLAKLYSSTGLDGVSNASISHVPG